MSALPLLRPDGLAAPGVAAAMSLRDGGVSGGSYASLNLGAAVGDDAAAVQENRARFAGALAARPVWLRQVHGSTVLELRAESPESPDSPDRPGRADRPGPPDWPGTPADAAWTCARGVACTVLVADCMPVLFALRDGSAVAAAHAGWRGLAGGVLEATVHALCAGSGAVPADVLAWLGPCIGPRQFEVGADVLQAFGQAPETADGRRFRARTRPDGSPRWLADLQQLARDRLQAAGVLAVNSAAECTVEQDSRFFSFRRDRVTGRMACAIWRV